MTQTVVEPRAAILGLGNVLLGDDGFGPFTVEVFRSLYDCGRDVEIVDVGTPGLDLGPYLYGKQCVVIVDAVNADGEPGLVRTYNEGEFLDHQAQLRLTDHDSGVQECIARLRLAGHGPAEICVVGVIPESCAWGQRISSTVLQVTSVAIENIAQWLRERGFHCQKKSCPEEPDWVLGLGRNVHEYV